MAHKNHFNSKIGLIAATVGSAVGLGNVWRFPAEVQTNGGAAFLILYIVCVFILGIPVMLTEFSVGRAGRSDAIGSLRNVGARGFWPSIGGIGILAGYLILSFYMVVAGWTFEYLCHSVTGSLFDLDTSEGMRSAFATKREAYVGGSWSPLINTYIMTILTMGVLMRGVQKGIEKISNILMPLLFVILVVFMIVALMLPGAGEGLAFFFKPDWSAMTPKVALNALGQAFFSLSLGMGALATYASYFPADTRLTKTAVTVSALDLTVAVLMGMIIFPAVTSFGLQGEGLEGATLVFITLPEVFASMQFTQLWSILFFLLLTMAALTSCISLAEVTIAWLCDRFKMSRVKAVALATIPLISLSTLCSLSQGPLADFKIFGMTVFDLLDTVATNWMLPLGALLMCVFVGWKADKSLMPQQLSNNGTIKSVMTPAICFAVKWIAPGLILMIFISNFL